MDVGELFALAIESHILGQCLVLNKPIVETGEVLARAWHIHSRRGVYYGVGQSAQRAGGYGAVTLHPLDSLKSEQDKLRFLQYVFRHEPGHMIGGLQDQAQDSEDSIMKPVLEATPELLAAKNIEFTQEQIEVIRAYIERYNMDSYRTWQLERDTLPEMSEPVIFSIS